MPSDSFPAPWYDGRPPNPGNERCPVCGGELRHGFAYLSAGAMLLSKDGRRSLHTDRLRVFFHVGFHGRHPEMLDSSDVPVVEDLAGGQFDLHWCSTACMREWFLRLVREVELRAQQSRPTDGQ